MSLPALSTTGPARFDPPVPMSIDDLGLPPFFLDQLTLKHLYFAGELTGRSLASHLGLNFSVVEPLLDALKRQRLLGVRSSMGMGTVSAFFTLTDAGRALAREYLDNNTYTGRAPVPLEQYSIGVQMQSIREGWLEGANFRNAFQHMIISDRVLAQLGPAVNSGKSLLLYGQPGNGKTFLAEALFNLESDPVYIPFALECQGHVIQLFDPVLHLDLDKPDKEESIFAVAPKEREYDGRWMRIKRPFIMSGGELTLDMLDLTFNPASKVYDAPFHLRANNGIYLIDDFGRQRVSPSEVLNRWIVPMERRVDYLHFHTGGKVSVPFETFLVFSTNLHPKQLGDEAFLRRIAYKLYLRNPDEAEFLEIFELVCRQEHLAAPPAVIEELFERHYRAQKKPLRRCHPRDLVTHAIDLIRFEHLNWELTPEILDRAFEITFINAEYED